jgi:hypothetical protein
LEWTFFGQNFNFIKLTPEMVNNSYEQIFLMTYHMGWNFFDAYSLPIALRNWFFTKWIEKKKSETEVINS